MIWRVSDSPLSPGSPDIRRVIGDVVAAGDTRYDVTFYVTSDYWVAVGGVDDVTGQRGSAVVSGSPWK